MKPKSITLAILAGGMGSRYGGDKQIARLGPHEEWLMEYAFFDALRVGCSKVVLVIRDELRGQFEAHLLPRWSQRLEIDFVVQRQPNERKKPWGTADATLALRDRINTPFILINADDFYGIAAFEALYRFLSNCDPSTSEWAMVSYPLFETLSTTGSVSRGVSKVSSSGYLEQIVEETQITHTPRGPQSLGRLLLSETPVSVNFWGFTPRIFDALELSWQKFFEQHHADPKAECFLPNVVSAEIQAARASVRVLPEGKQWLGVTYPEEAQLVSSKLLKLHQLGQYPERLSANDIA